MTDDERKNLVGQLEKMDTASLKTLNLKLMQQLRAQEDLNSAFPATQEFLKARGLTNVRQLDDDGKKALVEHLNKTLADIMKNSS